MILSEPAGARLEYFHPVLREVQRERFPDAWAHLQLNLGRCEDYQQNPAHTAGRARPNLEQAGRRITADGPSLRTATDQQGETR